MRPTVLTDMDGVIVDLLPEWLDQYYQMGGERVYPEHIHEYNWENSVSDPQLFKKVLRSSGLFYTAKPMLGALEGLMDLRAFADVYLVTKVTAGNSRAFDAKGGWLWRWVQPAFPRDQVIFTAAKHMVRGDYLVEDAPQNISRWLNAWPEGRAFVIDQPYNQAYAHPRCTRVETLEDVAFIIKENLNASK